jgi:hypothetical protein
VFANIRGGYGRRRRESARPTPKEAPPFFEDEASVAEVIDGYLTSTIFFSSRFPCASST